MQVRNLQSNFNRGDLLYGLNVHRKNNEKLLVSKVGHEVKLIVDEYNKIIISRLTDSHDHYNISESSNAAFHNWLESKSSDSKKIKEIFPQNSYPDAFLLQLKNHYKKIKDVSYRKVSVVNNEFPINVKKLSPEQRKTRRACKARLLDNDITIHFILQDLNFKHVFNRAYSLLNKNEYKLEGLICPYDSYTASELRFIMKHYDEIQNHIKFYLKKTGQYEEVNFFDVIAREDDKAKKFLTEWALDKNDQNKLHVETLKKILTVTAVQQQVEEVQEVEEEKEQNNSFATPPRTPPRTPRRMDDQTDDDSPNYSMSSDADKENSWSLTTPDKETQESFSQLERSIFSPFSFVDTASPSVVAFSIFKSPEKLDLKNKADKTSEQFALFLQK